ncbi:O-antigen ligase family protein [uncultured Desulfobulbus sp.]|uniref:O-antigen ligase family protein n=1 Tax=uncultured Desulfobulbus sp. TaxID=239745 RepID=UPI0029C68438|nr:O-antigen ligase family protein [uncultured Desulfobulbus sp.]
MSVKIEKTEKIPWIVEILLIVFLFAIPFESINVLGSDKGSTVSRIIGMILFASYIVTKGRYGKIPKALIYFAVYYFFVTLRITFTNVVDYSEQYRVLLTMLQMIAMTFITYDLFKHEYLRKDFIAAFGLSCGLLAILTFFGLATTNIETDYGDRVSAFGENANKFGQLMAISIIMFLSIWLERKKYHLLVFIGSLISAPFCMWALINSGSRGSLVGLLSGLFVWFIFSSFVLKKNKTSLIKQIAVILIVGIGIFAVYQFSDVAQYRWNLTFQTYDTGERTDIFYAASDMFLEKPIYGWGSVALTRELGSRLGLQSRDTHNILLWVILEVGLLGGIPWIFGVWGCVKNSISAATKLHDPLPIMLATTVLICGMSSNNFQKKTLWLILAFALSSIVIIQDIRKSKGT